MRRSPIVARARRLLLHSSPLVAACVLAAWIPLASTAATSSTVVGATVPSATAITPACATGAAGVTDIGNMLPGTAAATSLDCSVTFSSSNDTAQLRLGQTDLGGNAMRPAPVTGLVGDWPMNGSTIDISATANPISPLGGGTAPTWVAGSTANGQALRFDGVDDFATIPDNPALNLAQFTVDLWFRTTTISNVSHPVMVGKGNCGSGTQCNYELYFEQATNEIHSDLTVGGTYRNTTASAAGLLSGAWHHAATTADGTNLRLYVDGVLVDTTPLGGAVDQNVLPLTLGNQTGLSNDFQGDIDQLRVQSVVRSAAEIHSYAQGVVADFVAGSDDWTSAGSRFGVCLHTLSAPGAVVAPWTVAGTNNCTTSLPANWRAVPDSTALLASKVATTPAAGNSSVATFRFAFRADAGLPPGSYRAPVTFDVLAPS
jgi:hypothetical protein